MKCAPAGGQVRRFGLTPLAGLPEDASHDETPVPQRGVQAASRRGVYRWRAHARYPGSTLHPEQRSAFQSEITRVPPVFRLLPYVSVRIGLPLHRRQSEQAGRVAREMAGAVRGATDGEPVIVASGATRGRPALNPCAFLSASVGASSPARRARRRAGRARPVLGRASSSRGKRYRWGMPRSCARCLRRRCRTQRSRPCC